MDIIGGRSLTIESFAEACRPAAEERSHVDLSATRFVDAYALVAIACVLAGTRDRGRAAHITLPNQGDVTRYLARMHLQRALAGTGVTATGHLPSVREHDQSGNLLVLSRFEDLRGGEELAELVFERLEGRVDNAVVTALYEAIVELCANTAEHADLPGGGFLCAQTYRRGEPGEYLVFGVGDIGVGLRGSLARRYEDLTEDRALGLALQRDVSSTGDPGRGQGLAEIVETAGRLRGRVAVHSGAARAESTRERADILASADLPGTLVGTSLPCRPGSRHQ